MPLSSWFTVFNEVESFTTDLIPARHQHEFQCRS